MVYFLQESCYIDSGDINKLYIFMGLSSSVNLAILIILLFFKIKVFSAIMWVVLGFWLSPNLLVWYWYSVEIAFPLKETTFSSMFLITAELMGFAFSFGSSMFIEYFHASKYASIVVIVFWIFNWILGALISFWMKRINYNKIEDLRNIVSVGFGNNSIDSDY